MCALPLRRQTMDILHSPPDHLFQHITLHLLAIFPAISCTNLTVCFHEKHSDLSIQGKKRINIRQKTANEKDFMQKKGEKKPGSLTVCVRGIFS